MSFLASGLMKGFGEGGKRGLSLQKMMTQPQPVDQGYPAAPLMQDIPEIGQDWSFNYDPRMQQRQNPLRQLMTGMM